MFIQPCFIRKNTPELRKKLEELGYVSFKYSTQNIIKSNNIVASLGCIFDIYPINIIKRGFNNCIDCGINEELFLALAALRNDTDKNQWVIDEANECFFGWENSWSICDKDDMNERVVYTHYRKATVEEIIEHFKDK